MTENKLNKEDITYIYDRNLCSECNRLPCAPKRVSNCQTFKNCNFTGYVIVITSSGFGCARSNKFLWINGACER